MKLSRDWIASYVDLPQAVEEVAERLTAAGHAVDGVEEHGEDRVLEVDITTNRPDCMNHFGMARELSVIFDRPLSSPEDALDEVAEPAASTVSISIDAPELCHRYVGRVVRGVTIAASPPWLIERLEAIGLRPINNVVDITNFVLWELGQPLHAFDLDKIRGAKIAVREARTGETLTTLDEVERKLEAGMLLIVDAERPIALAGVMGGAETEVSEATHDLLIESAHFDPTSVRRTAGALGMHTDASHRFERGADPEICARAAQRAARLIAEIAGGEVLEGAIDVYPRPYKAPTIDLDLARLSAFAGVDFAAGDVERLLGGLGFGLERSEARQAPAWSVSVPSWRHRDVELPADLYEEIVRLHGYDKIPATLPTLSGADGQSSAAHSRAHALRLRLAACGFSEAITFAFHDAEADALYPGLLASDQPLELANPLSDLYRVMRRSLLPNLLAGARFNQRRGASDLRLFEIGHVFAASGDAAHPITEFEVLALVAGGVVGNAWDHRRELDFFDLKGAVELLTADAESSLEARPAERSGMLAGSTAELWAGEELVGFIGRIEGDDDAYPLYAAEVRTTALAARSELRIEPPSRFPGVRADLTLTHALEVPWAEIRQAIDDAAPQALTEVALEGRYRGKGVPEGAVNTTIHFLYSSPEGSLTQEEVNERQAALAGELKRRFGWKD